jgi:putative ABC transport system permease protein
VRSSALNRKLARDAWRLRGHLLAVAVVAACGAASYVTMQGSYEGLVAARDRFYAEGRFADVFATVKRAPRTLLPRIERIPGVATVQDRLAQEISVEVPGFEEPVTALLVSLPEGRPPALNDVQILKGRSLAGATEEVLVGEAFAGAHTLKPGDRLAGAINGRWERLRVAGIAISPEFVHLIGGAGIFPDDLRYGVLWKGRRGMEAALDMKDGFNSLALRLAPGAEKEQVMAQLDALLAPYGGAGAFGRDEQVSHQMLEGEIQQDRVTGVVVPAIFLGVAGFLIHNVLTRLIALQRAQIGVLKAFGYGNAAVAGHFVVLALIAVLAGCAAGIAGGFWLGAGLAEIYRAFFHLPGLAFRLSPANLLGVVAVCCGAGVASALPAVRRVARLPPAEAMRPEAPPRYRPLLLERLGCAALLPASWRMLFRNLERRPLRALVSVLALSLGVALLVVSQFGLDSLDETVRVQFRAARRDDVRLAFTQARGTQVRHDLAALPGVLESEAIRVAPARLRHEHRSRRAALYGLPPGQQLHRVLDLDEREVAVPPEGIVLGAALADILGARAGDRIVVEFLEGGRRIREVPVVATVDEAVGLSGYLDERALSRLMGEGPAYTDAYLRVDPRQLETLYRRLKELPAVAGVTLREAMLQSFMATIAENLLISLSVLIGFACAIAAAVVYNGARIALSEHAITLASLRVLGFTRREVRGILLGEQGILVVLAIPAGYLLGYGLSAWLSYLLQTEMFRLPLTLSARTFLSAGGVEILSAAGSGALVAWKLRALDLVAVLKARE